MHMVGCSWLQGVLCITYGVAYIASTSNIYNLFIWAPKNMKQFVGVCFSNIHNVD